MAYLRINLAEREKICKFLSQKFSLREIAKELTRSVSTISEEVRRNGMDRNTYSPSLANNQSINLRKKQGRKYKLKNNKKLMLFVEEKLKDRWSPEQISGYLKKQFSKDPNMQISRESIYKYIFNNEDEYHKRNLIKLLRHKRKFRYKRKKNKGKKNKIPNLISIHNRAKEAENRNIPGHWEGDFIVGARHKTAIGTLVERSTKYTIIVPLIERKDSESTAIEFAKAFSKIPLELKKSLTYDRGSEMSMHEKFSNISNVPVYFADPHSPWQRGTNENTNGLLRNFFHKGCDFKLYLKKRFKEVEELLNKRPRKSLNFATPEEVFFWLTKHPGATLLDFW